MIRFFPRMLCPLEIDVTLFVNKTMCFDSVEGRFNFFPDILRCCQFQVIRIFLHIPMDDFIVEISELPYMKIVIPVQGLPHLGNGDIGCAWIQLKFQQPVQMLLEIYEMFQFPAFVPGKLFAVFVCQEDASIVPRLPKPAVLHEDRVIAQSFRNFDFANRFFRIAEKVFFRLGYGLDFHLRNGKQQFRQR